LKKVGCLVLGGDNYCLEIVDSDEIISVTIRVNGRVTSTRKTRGNVFIIFEEELTVLIGSLKGTTLSYRNASKCVTVLTDYIVCVEVTETTEGIRVVIRRNRVVIKEFITVGILLEVLTKEISKYTVTSVFPKVNKCLKLSTGDTICVEGIIIGDVVLVNRMKNGKIITSKDLSGEISVIVEEDLTEYFKEVSTRQITVVTTTKCLFFNGTVAYCVEVTQTGRKLTVTVMKNGFIVITRETEGNILSIIEEEFIKLFEIEKIKITKSTKTQCITVLTDYIVCVEVTEITEGIRVVIRRNGLVIKEFITVGNLFEVLTREIRKYTVTSVFPKVNKCLKLSTGDTICVEGIIIGDVVLVNRMKNGKIITSKDLSGEISVIVEEDLTEYFKEVSTRQITVVTTTKCLFFNGTVAYCVEVTQTGRKLTVTVMKNGFIVITRETEGNILSIIEEEFIKLFEIEKIKITKSTKTQCITVLTDYIVCVEVTEITEGIRVVIRRNGLVIKEFITVGNLLDILLREINKYIVKNVIPKVTKCLKLSTRDTICAEGIIVGDVVILNRMKNGKIVATEDVQGDVDVSVEDELTEYFQDVSKPSIAVQTTTKCRFFNGTVAYCVEIVQSGKKLTVTVMKNGFVVEESETEGNIVDIIEEEFIKLFINEKIKDYKAAKSTNRCKTLSSGDKICVEVIEDAGKLIVTVKKNGKIIHARETRGNLADVLESELFKYTNEDDSIEVAKGVVKGKTMTKCASTNTGDKICVDIKDEGQYLTVIIKKNESVIVTKQVTGSATNVLNQELQNYINQLSNPNHSGSSSKKKCMILPNRDQICVEINNFAGMNMAKITRNGILIRSKPHRFGRPEDILLEEVNALRNG
jgi:hypothetical protein